MRRLNKHHKKYKVTAGHQPAAHRFRTGTWRWYRRQKRKGNKHPYFKRF